MKGRDDKRHSMYESTEAHIFRKLRAQGSLQPAGTLDEPRRSCTNYCSEKAA